MNRSEAQELLPWFVAGTLSEEENRAVEAFIESGEIAQSEIDELALFAESVADQAAHEPAYDRGILDNVMAQLDTVEQDAFEPLIVAEPEPKGWLAALRERLQWAGTPPVARWAMAGQFALVVAMGAALWVSQADQGGQYFGTVSGADAAGTADVNLVVQPTTTVADLRVLLKGIDGQIVSGPTANGIYGIDLPDAADVDAALEALRANAATLYAEEVVE